MPALHSQVLSDVKDFFWVVDAIKSQIKKKTMLKEIGYVTASTAKQTGPFACRTFLPKEIPLGIYTCTM